MSNDTAAGQPCKYDKKSQHPRSLQPTNTYLRIVGLLYTVLHAQKSTAPIIIIEPS